MLGHRAASLDQARYLSELKAADYKGVTSNIAFDEDGKIEQSARTLMTCKGGKRTELAVMR